MPIPGYTLSFDSDRLDMAVIHGFLEHSYWSPGIPLATVEKAVRNSLCIGVYTDAGAQVGFARMVTDRATFAYLADVFVLDPHRGKGLATWMTETLLAHPELQGIRRMMLATADAHALYAAHGFTPLEKPGRFMEKHRPDIYQRPD